MYNGVAEDVLCVLFTLVGGIHKRRVGVACEKRTITLFECFPYVCPEPVLVKWCILYSYEWRKKWRFSQRSRRGRGRRSRMGWPVRKRSSFLKFPPCLSRACLGKKIVHILYMALKDRVHTPSSTTTAIKIQKTGLFLSARFASVCPEPVWVK